MRLLAHAKINWSLAVLSRRADGYHALDTLMQSVAFADEVTLREGDGIALSASGPVAVPEGPENLMIRAAAALQNAAGIRRGAAMHLTKRIPTGAGLGGGSADAAAVLVGLNRLWHLGMPDEALCEIAASLGADVPFCLAGGLARAQGIGEKLSALSADRSYPLVITKPTAGLSTPDVFRAYDALTEKPANPDTDALLQALGAKDGRPPADLVGNALTGAAARLLPEILTCVRMLETHGALCAWMTGSGSAAVGLFASDAEAASASRELGRIFLQTVQTRTIDRGITILSD